MQPLEKHREVNAEGVNDTAMFGISYKDQAHIMTILRDTLYSDKILAVLREYGANAWDANRMAGKPDVPIKVHLPTWTNPNLIITDYGDGLSHDDVFKVFTQYGASTKRDSNTAVGMLGIGSKSGFAYSDTFTIISRHSGKQRIYVAFLDESEKGAINLISEEDYAGDTGVSIQIACKNEDIHEFQNKALNLYKWFKPRPEINLTLPDEPEIMSRLKNGMIFGKKARNSYRDYYDEDGEWIAVMGCVPYQIELKQLKNPDGTNRVSRYLNQNSGVLYFDIGEVQINASREALKYSQFTKDALVARFDALLEEFVTTTLDDIENGNFTKWEKRVRAQVLNNLGIDKKELNDEEAILVSDRVLVKQFPDSFTIQNHTNGSIPTGITVSPFTELVRKNGPDNRKITGYTLGSVSYLVIPNQGFEWDVVNSELNDWISRMEIDGIPITNLIDKHWQPANSNYSYRKSYPPDSKHHRSSFVLNDDRKHNSDKFSNNWNVEQRKTTKDDVYVLLKGFETSTVDGQTFNIFRERKLDLKIAEVMGIKLPPIYGYKITKKNPKGSSRIKGIHYLEWRKEFFKNLPKDKLTAFNEAQAWKDLPLYHDWDRRWTPERVENLATRLGPTHPIVIHCGKVLKVLGDPDYQALQTLMKDNGVSFNIETEAKKSTDFLTQKYPLLMSYNLIVLNHDIRREEWLKYIELIDSLDVIKSTYPTVNPPEILNEG